MLSIPEYSAQPLWKHFLATPVHRHTDATPSKLISARHNLFTFDRHSAQCYMFSCSDWFNTIASRCILVYGLTQDPLEIQNEGSRLICFCDLVWRCQTRGLQLVLCARVFCVSVCQRCCVLLSHILNWYPFNLTWFPMFTLGLWVDSVTRYCLMTDYKVFSLAENPVI